MSSPQAAQVFHHAGHDEQARRRGAADVHAAARALLGLAQLAAHGLQVGQ